MTKKIKVIKNSDKLSAAFSAYNSLLNIEYEIIIKNGGCIESFAEKKFSAPTACNLEKEILISFFKENFYHLTGLHHSNLTKLTQYNRNGKTQANFYDDVKNGKVTDEDLQNSERKDYILQRLEILSSLETIIDRASNLRDYDGFLYVENKKNGVVKGKEKIGAANCFIYNNENDLIFPEADNIFIFFSLNGVKTYPTKQPRYLSYCTNPCSIVFKENVEEEDYNRGHNRLTILVRKKDYANNKRETLYIAPGYVVNRMNIIKKELEYYKADKNRFEAVLRHPKATEEFKKELLSFMESL